MGPNPNNPFVAQAGTIKGLRDHLLVGLTAATAATECALPAALLGGIFFAAVGGGLSREDVKIGFKMGLALGASLGAWIGISGGYENSVYQISRSIQTFKSSALEQTAPTIQAPVRFSMQPPDGRVTACLNPAYKAG